MSDDRLKDVPELARDGSNLAAVISSIREALQTFRGYRGDPLDRALTVRSATAIGVLLPSGAFAGSSVPGPAGPIGPAGPPGDSYTPDLTAPPTPSGLVVTAGLTAIFVECDNPVYTQGHGHSMTVVYGAQWPTGGTEPTFVDAVELFRFEGQFGAYPTGTDTRWCIWIKWLSNDAVLSVSPAGGTNGVQATTSLVATDDLQDLSITTAKIGTAAITDAKVANLSAAKLTAGTGVIGGPLYSSNYVTLSTGWALMPSGYFEAQNAVIRGTVYASAGQIGGNAIDATGMQSPGYTYGSTGWRLDTSGLIKAFASSGARVLDLSATGSDPVFRIDSAFEILANGSASFSGALAAATGTFAGSLSAATGTFSGALVAATGSFGGSLQAGTVDISTLVGSTTTYTTPGTYTITPPASYTQMKVLLVGGGGPGVRAGNRAGGGGGGTVVGIYTVTPGTNYTLTVGQGGVGSSSSGTAGTAGGNTSITGIATAGGGQPATWSTVATPGAGGTGTLPGQPGKNHANGASGGNSGGNYGIGGLASVFPANNVAGLYGGGGGGASYFGPTMNGAHGLAVIEFSNPNGVVIRSEYTTLTSALQRQGIAIV